MINQRERGDLQEMTPYQVDVLSVGNSIWYCEGGDEYEVIAINTLNIANDIFKYSWRVRSLEWGDEFVVGREELSCNFIVDVP